MTTSISKFQPDYDREHPGIQLKWRLDERGFKIVDFAKRCGRPTKTISEIISGNTSITPETALQFEKVLGESAAMWLALETKYQLHRARTFEKTKTESLDAVTWVKKFPVKEMASHGFLSNKPDKSSVVDDLLRFFGVSSISAWDEYWATRVNLAWFKQQNANKVNSYGVAAWMRQGEILANSILEHGPDFTDYTESKFRSVLSEIRELTCSPWKEIQDEFIKLCASAGIVVVLIPSLPKTGLRGAAFWIRKDRPVILLSDYLKTEANIWFAFFHEAAHILLHSKKTVFLDQNDMGTSEREIEAEADRFSANALIPQTLIDNYKSNHGSLKKHVSISLIQKIALDINIDPGLLLVRLQWEKAIPVNYRITSKLRRVISFD